MSTAVRGVREQCDEHTAQCERIARLEVALSSATAEVGRLVERVRSVEIRIATWAGGGALLGALGGALMSALVSRVIGG